MTYDDKLMTVFVNGEYETRMIDYVEGTIEDVFSLCKPGTHIPRNVPVLHKGERLLWAVGTDIPMIFTS